jgi:polysaccharide biosynthesis protein PslH
MTASSQVTHRIADGDAASAGAAPLRILWLAPKWTLPATDGARVATDRLLRAVVAAGAVVDVYSLSAVGEDTDPVEMCRQWNVVSAEALKYDRPKSLAQRLGSYLSAFLREPFTPVTFAAFSDRMLQQCVANKIASKPYDIVLLEGMHLCALFIQRGKWIGAPTAAKIVLRAHNVEHELWTTGSANTGNPIIAALLRWQGRLVERLERVAVTAVAGIGAIASEDAAIFRSWGARNVTWVPLGLDFSDPVPLESATNGTFLFVGRLDWPPNVDALKWLLDEVWPKVRARRADARLRVVGSGDTTWLQKYQSVPGVEIVGFAKDLHDAYAPCAFTVVPMHYGSGTRIKVVESFSMGRPLISTTMGVQGSGVDESMYYRADSVDEWVEMLSTIVLDESVSARFAAARQRMAAAYDYRMIGSTAYTWMQSLISRTTSQQR